MNYLMIYEAFQAKAISDIIKYIRKTSSRNVNKFIEELKAVQNTYDFQLEKIQSDDIKYISTKKALNLVPDDSTTYYNDKKVFNIKFWFSIENGFLGRTATGDYNHKSNKIFNDDEIRYIKDVLDIKTGELSPVYDYNELKTGDFIILFLSEYSDKSDLVMARIFKENKQIYAIQNLKDGSSPNSENWNQFGMNGWSLGQAGSPGNDHSKLNLYNPSNEELKYNDQFNPNKELYILSSGNLDVNNLPEYQDNSDFAIVLDINNVFKKGFENLSTLKKKRQDDKLGATSLMSDKDIKKANIDKYLGIILNNMGVKIDTTYDDLKDLQKLVKTIIYNDLAFYCLFNDFGTHMIKSISNDIYNLISSESNEDDIRIFDAIKRNFAEIKKNNKKIIDKFRISLSVIDKDGSDEIKQLFSKFDDLSKIIIDYVDSTEINNLYDLNAVYYKLNYITNLINDDRFRFSKTTGRILGNLEYPYDVSDYIDRNLNTSDIESDIKILSHLVKNIKTTLN